MQRKRQISAPSAITPPSILLNTEPITIDGAAAIRIRLHGGLLATTTNRRILAVSEVVPTLSNNRAGSSIWVPLVNLNF